jgi:hypothetical protein
MGVAATSTCISKDYSTLFNMNYSSFQSLDQ